MIEEPAHIQALAEHKRAAGRQRATDRLVQAVPACRDLLIRAAARNDNLGSLTAAMMKLLEHYGAAELQEAVLDALSHGAPHPNSVRCILDRRRQARKLPPPVAVNLSESAKAPPSAPTRSPPMTPSKGPAMTDRDRSARPAAQPPVEPLRRRARALNLHGLLAHWPDAATAPWLQHLIQWEEEERARRSLERRLRAARIGRFKPLCDFDWNWPVKCDRAAIEDLMSLDFLGEAANAVLRGPNEKP